MHNDEGFTLIELMIVILIIGILVGIAVPVFASSRTNAELRTCKSNMRLIKSASSVYAASNDSGAYPGDMSDLYPAHLDIMPECPVTGPYDQAPNSIDWNGCTAPPDPTCSEHGTFSD
jgi:prepilin-type N-terminal cleavage/methylation domain-containing protein